MTKKLQIRNSTAEFLVFTNQAGENTIEVAMRLNKKLSAMYERWFGERVAI